MDEEEADKAEKVKTKGWRRHLLLQPEAAEAAAGTSNAFDLWQSPKRATCHLPQLPVACNAHTQTASMCVSATVASCQLPKMLKLKPLNSETVAPNATPT